MAFRNSIIFKTRGKIKFDTTGAITLPIDEVKKIEIYKCPLRLDDVEGWAFEQGVLTVDKPGRYLITYE